MGSSRAASRVVIGVGLAVVFGIGVSMILEQGAQNQAAHQAVAATASSDLPAANPPAADAAASLRNAATAPQTPPAAASPGPLASRPPDASNANESSALSNDTNVPKPRQ